MLKYLKNIFVIVFIVFAIWMLFIDSNSLLIHRELNQDIEDLENEKDYYKKEIEKDKKAIKELSTDEGVEKLAREKYYMKKDNEDIYIIEYEDSLNLEKKDE
ncbi:FtsB family cell division protein [Psychroserpens algicola]|uniref:Septum formation initiator family protein n=1 Tax=Psychroserpens algicola TaxID=1719034 RepID=A0ABT0HC58_9FLAO|nr:septum formation initiator family protein [Psychroserpens algicola]MCK8481432.1 septum formation initiator family protein [Psychroserpens algicola]